MASQPRFDPFTGQPLAAIAQVPPALKHSGPGIASFVLSLVFGTVVFFLFCIAGYLEITTPGGVDEESGEAIALGLAILGALAVTLCGLVLGIVGLVLPNRRKGFAAAGVAINACALLGAIAVMVMGALLP